MNYPAKYVIVDEYPVETPYIFPSWVKHSDFVDRMYINDHEIVSAGFVVFGPEGANAYGNLVSLRKKSRPIDSEIMDRYFYNGERIQ